MKFLLALLVMMSNAFADDFNARFIKCYEAPQQTGEWELAYKFKTHGENIKLVYPEKLDLIQEGFEENDTGISGVCLTTEEGGEGRFFACLAEGQRIHKLIPVTINEETVYCEKPILNWIEGIPTTL